MSGVRRQQNLEGNCYQDKVPAEVGSLLQSFLLMATLGGQNQSSTLDSAGSGSTAREATVASHTVMVLDRPADDSKLTEEVEQGMGGWNSDGDGVDWV